MKAGREVDALVAEKVMGLKVIRRPWPDDPDWDEYFEVHPNGEIREHMNGDWVCVRQYSTSIEAAWEVMEKLRKEVALTIHPENLFGGWLVYIDREIRVVSESAPHAICLAALKAVGAEP